MADPEFLRRLHAGFGVPRDEVIGFVERESGSTVRDIERLTVGDENEVYRVMLAGMDRMALVTINQMVGHLAWSVLIENTAGTAHGVSVLRAALEQLER